MPTDATRQLSTSGTPRGPDGKTQPDEYVDELRSPLHRMQVFEEMGQGDDAVRTAIEARRQEINSANWLLSTEDKSDLGTQILEFCEDAIYPFLDELLRLLGGGALQYGVGIVEPVFAWSDRAVVQTITRGTPRATKSGERRIYLRGLAHLRQPTISTFVLDDSSGMTELKAVTQAAYNGASYAIKDIPAEKLLLWTYNRQGDDYWGVPPTRHCYKAWKLKTQLERLNILSFDRFGVGMPVAEEGEGWGDTERKRLGEFLTNMRMGAKDYVIHPNGGKITIVSGDGKMVMSALEWVKFYNIAIAKVFLTQLTELGSTHTGSRAVGQSFIEQMEALVQADCEELATLLNSRLIVPLVNWNFGPQASYPQFTPSQRVRAGQNLAQVLSQLDGHGLHMRPEDEAYLRDAYGLPSVPIETLKAEADQRKAMVPPPPNPDAPPAPGQPPQQPPSSGGGPGPSPAPATAPADAAALARHSAVRALALTTSMADGCPDPAAPGQTSYRTPEYTTWEHGIVRPDVMMRDLDQQTARLGGEVQDVLTAIDTELARQAAAIAQDGASALKDHVREIAVPDALRTQLRTVLLTAAARAKTYGAQAVRNEIERQLGPQGIGPQRNDSMAPFYAGPNGWRRIVARVRALIAGDAAAADTPDPRDLYLDAEVDRAVEDEVDRREQSARGAILTALAQAATQTGAVLATVVGTAMKAAFVGLSTGRTQQNVASVVNVAFNVGRSDEAEAINAAADRLTSGAPAPAGSGAKQPPSSAIVDASGNPVHLVSKVYSAVMDMGTCDECAKWDGATFPMDYPEDFTGVQAPNPRCAGGYGRCRCIWIYVTDEESAPLVPPSKGPQPVASGVANS